MNVIISIKMKSIFEKLRNDLQTSYWRYLAGLDCLTSEEFILPIFMCIFFNVLMVDTTRAHTDPKTNRFRPDFDSDLNGMQRHQFEMAYRVRPA